MDVQYRPKDWVEMKDGLDQITKDTFVKLFDANRLLADTQGKIQDLDEDRSINFHYKDQTEIIAKLREAYTTLGKFCDEAGQAVYDAIDKPFFVQMDQFAQKMRDVSIKNFETTNRMGFTTITTVQGSSGYGETAQTIKTTKNTITVDDIFKESYAFDEVLRADYEERKRQDPTLKLDYEEYRKHIPSTRGFEYLSIEDDQKKLETWRDFGIGVITIGGLFICPPLGIAAGTVFGILEVKSAYDGEDWETHRKLDKEERVVRGVFGGLDAMSGAGSLMKSAKGIGTLVKLPGDGTNFNPNVGKNMVQSLRDNNTLKNTLIPVGVSWMDTAGIGIKMPVVRFSKVGEIGEDFTKARVVAKDDPYQHIKGSGGSGVSSEGSVVKGTGNREAEVPPAFRQTDFASSYEARYNQTPSPVNSKVEFEGIRGESLSTLKPPPDPILKRILDEAGIKGIQYKNGVPDFSPVSKAQVEINYMVGGTAGYGSAARRLNFTQADEKLAEQLNNSPELARKFGMESGGITWKQIEKYRRANKLTWHELNDVKIVQLVPTEINSKFGHLGGVGEINAGAFMPNGFASKQ
ncbi:HNH endonuclease [Bacillus wiedmannii]|uniref:HNH endonuclease n=1 Tax=Bacillus wiedmannii TaxID=1890302 RepID=UPI0021002C22|nr:HNH endonuclease [Bacillus wiedmannii]